MGLPDAVCSTFLDKMENANLSSLPPLSPSRLALVKRALRCLVNYKQAQLSWLTKTGHLLYKSEDLKSRLRSAMEKIKTTTSVMFSLPIVSNLFVLQSFSKSS